MSTNDQIQGEGNHEAGRRYDEAQKRFVDSGQVPKAASPIRTAPGGEWVP